MSSSLPSSGRGGSVPHHDPAQLELRYLTERPHLVKKLLENGLTECQRDVCYLTLEVKGIKAIAALRRCSEKTVEKLRGDSLKRLQAPPEQNLKKHLLLLIANLPRIA